MHEAGAGGRNYPRLLASFAVMLSSTKDIWPICCYGDQTIGLPGRRRGQRSLAGAAHRTAGRLTDRGWKRALLLTDPAKYDSDEYIQSTAQYVHLVVRVFGGQGIMVTHKDYLAGLAVRVFQVEPRDGEIEPGFVG